MANDGQCWWLTVNWWHKWFNHGLNDAQLMVEWWLMIMMAMVLAHGTRGLWWLVMAKIAADDGERWPTIVLMVNGIDAWSYWWLMMAPDGKSWQIMVVMVGGGEWWGPNHCFMMAICWGFMVRWNSATGNDGDDGTDGNHGNDGSAGSAGDGNHGDDGAREKATRPVMGAPVVMANGGRMNGENGWFNMV